MKNYIILVFTLVFFSACSSEKEYPLTEEMILKQYDSKVEIVKTGGADGPYRDAGGCVGNPDCPLGFSWKTSTSETKVEWPAEKGYYFQINGYENAHQKIFWILLRLPNAK